MSVFCVRRRGPAARGQKIRSEETEEGRGKAERSVVDRPGAYSARANFQLIIHITAC